MAQLTYSFCRHELVRIPAQLKKDLDAALATSAADEETKKLIEQVCAAVETAVTDLCYITSDQLMPR